MIRTKRIYAPPEENDGVRILVDRLWPRGMSKEKAAILAWLRDVSPSNELRKQFGHHHENWGEFRRLYWQELQTNPAGLEKLRQYIKSGPVTLLYAARDEIHNNAVALKEYLEEHNGI